MSHVGIRTHGDMGIRIHRDYGLQPRNLHQAAPAGGYTALPCKLQQALERQMLASLLISFYAPSNIGGCAAFMNLRTSLAHKTAAADISASLLMCFMPQLTLDSVRHTCFCIPTWCGRVWLLTRAGRQLICLP